MFLPWATAFGRSALKKKEKRMTNFSSWEKRELSKTMTGALCVLSTTHLYGDISFKRLKLIFTGNQSNLMTNISLKMDSFGYKTRDKRKDRFNSPCLKEVKSLLSS